MKADALISPDGLYRYWLTREWEPDKPEVCFVMLNPSTADALKDDPTIRKCIGFASRWHFGRLLVLNLFNYRATKPADLKRAADPIGPQALEQFFYAQSSHTIVVAWGAHGTLLNRDREVMNIFKMLTRRVYCLGTTKDGQPLHPLMQPYSLPLVGYRPTDSDT